MTLDRDRFEPATPLQGSHTVVCVDDEPHVLSSLKRLLERETYNVKITRDPLQVLEWVEQEDVSLILADQGMPEMTGTELGKAVRERRLNSLVAVITGKTDHSPIHDAISSGYVHCLITKPWDDNDLKKNIVRLLQERQRVQSADVFPELVGTSPSMAEIRRLIRKVGPTDTTVLITGETGTGKELVAQAVHQTSPRSLGPFLAVNCGAIPETLLESILFGHIRGTFTGADRDRRGLFQAAENGTLLLDEIGEMPVTLQPKILRALETREIMPVGSTVPLPISARVLAATNQDLGTMVRNRHFRSDLYFRLNVFEIPITPLRERSEDIPRLIAHLLERMCEKIQRPVPPLDPDALEILVQYPWPGNVRELANVLERALILAEAPSIRSSDLPSPVTLSHENSSNHLKSALHTFEQRHIARVLAKYGQDKRRTAQALGINLSSLYRKLTGSE